MKTIRWAAPAVCALLFACGTLLAQGRVSDTMRITPSLDIVPTEISHDATVTIYTDLGPSATDNYDDTDGYCVTGSSASGSCGGVTTDQWIGMPFTPKQNSHATQVQIAVGFFDGTNAFEIALYNDVSGAPGTPLKTVQAHNAPAFGTCCTLVSANMGTPGVSLTAGTQYWVVAQSNDTTAPTFSGAWALANNYIAGDVAQGGWSAFPSAPEAGVVKGTVP